MKYFLLVFGILFMSGCSKSMEEVEHLINSCKAAGGEPRVQKARNGYVEYVVCDKDGATYSNWKGKDK